MKLGFGTVNYLPSREAIEAACRTIQETWSDAERLKRARRSMRPVLYQIPRYAIHESTNSDVGLVADRLDDRY
jgi:hypothetical protein